MRRTPGVAAMGRSGHAVLILVSFTALLLFHLCLMNFTQLPENRCCASFPHWGSECWQRTREGLSQGTVTDGVNSEEKVQGGVHTCKRRAERLRVDNLTLAPSAQLFSASLRAASLYGNCLPKEAWNPLSAPPCSCSLKRHCSSSDRYFYCPQVMHALLLPSVTEPCIYLILNKMYF